MTEAQLSNAMDAYGSTVYRLALTRMQNIADAEDVYQEVFLRLWKQAAEDWDGDRAKAWLSMAYPHNAEPLRGSAPVPPTEAGTFFRGDTGSGAAGGREPGTVGSGEPPAGKGPDGGASLLRRGVFGGGDQPTDAHSRRHGPNPAPPGPQAVERTSGRY